MNPATEPNTFPHGTDCPFTTHLEVDVGAVVVGKRVEVRSAAWQAAWVPNVSSPSDMYSPQYVCREQLGVGSIKSNDQRVLHFGVTLGPAEGIVVDVALVGGAI